MDSPKNVHDVFSINNPHPNKSLYQQAFFQAILKIERNALKFNHLFPDSATVKGTYPLNVHGSNPDFNLPYTPGSNVGWTTGFWTGLLILAYAQTQNQKLEQSILAHLETYFHRVSNNIDCDTHDMGFLYEYSCIAYWRISQNPKAKQAALLAADYLMKRYIQPAGIFQAWGSLNTPSQQGRMIIDCLMNLPLLYWATEQTGLLHYREAANTHAYQALKTIVRPDFTTYHTYFFDLITGEPKMGKTFQGYSDDSCWARGQAWGIYGFALCYQYTQDEQFLTMAKKLADRFIKHLPSDYIVYWDLIFDDSSHQEKDSSAAAIAICGLLEIIKHIPPSDLRNHYLEVAHNMLTSLVTQYTDEASDGIILHGVYHKMGNVGVDESNLWGDYYYTYALKQMLEL